MKKSARFLVGTLIIGTALALALAGCPTDGGHGDPSAEDLAGRLAADLNKISAGSAQANGATVTLTGRVVIASDLTVPAGVTLDLTGEGELALRGAALTVNGTVNAGPQKVRLDDNASEGTINGSGTIQLKGQGYLLGIWSTKTFTLDGVTLAGVADNNEPLVGMSNGGAIVMKSGAITGNANIRNGSDDTANWAAGGGVYIGEDSAFTLEGGTISGNTAEGSRGSGGGGVRVDGAFTMQGGTISGNTAKSGGEWTEGGGVSVWKGAFTMKGGAISGNTVEGDNNCGGGGVRISEGSTFVMEDGVISGNTVQGDDHADGSGVSVYKGTFTMQGGVISGNTAQGGEWAGGGGVRVDEGSAFTMAGGAISGNTIESGQWSDGGGVQIINDSTFTMQGGTISGNTGHAGSPFGNGVGVDIAHNSTFTLEGGTIYGKSDRLPADVDPSLANKSALHLRVSDPPALWARWGTGGTYTKGVESQTGGSAIGSTDETLIAVPAN